VQRFGLSSRLTFAIIAITARGLACTVIYPPGVPVGPSFRVRVEVRGRPVQGLRVEISADRAVATTDKNGFALFSGVEPGSYHLNAGPDEELLGGADIEVKLNGPKHVTVPLTWPDPAPIFVRSLKGTIRGPDYLPGQSQRLSLDVLEGISGRTLKSLQTTENGQFNFEGAGPGLYFLNLKPSGLRDWAGYAITGRIAVAVDAGARTDHLDVDLGWSSCGLSYVDQGNCPHGDLKARQLSGAADPGATIFLLDSSDTIVEQLKTDIAGKFASPHTFAGNYQLVVSLPGFTPLRRTLHIGPTGSRGLNVHLGLPDSPGGGCSTAEAQ